MVIFENSSPSLLCHSLKRDKLWHETEEFFGIYGCLIISHYIRGGRKGQNLHFQLHSYLRREKEVLSHKIVEL